MGTVEDKWATTLYNVVVADKVDALPGNLKNKIKNICQSSLDIFHLISEMRRKNITPTEERMRRIKHWF